MEKSTITSIEKEAFEYLNAIQRSGAINMFGATPYVQEEFDLKRNEARVIMSKWMAMYNENGYDHLVVVD